VDGDRREHFCLFHKQLNRICGSAKVVQSQQEGGSSTCDGSTTDEGTYREVTNFLYLESDLIDQKKYRDWLGMTTEDVSYFMPARVSKEREAGVTLVSKGGFIIDDREALENRIKREETEYAWSENPPSMTRHFVTNIRSCTGKKEDELNVTSNVLLWIHRQDDLQYDLFSYQRQDVLRRVNGILKLAARKIIPDQTRLTIERISFLL
jgi:3-phenylpropionate/cinnamic acid dioxygenase small subunit